MLIRAIVESDLARYKALRLAALKSDPDAFGETFASASSMSDEEWAERLLRMFAAESVIFVAETDDTFVGMCAVGEDQNQQGRGYVWGVFVAAPYRRSGTAAQLMQHAESWAEGRGFKSIYGVVAAPNEQAIRFYRKLGYKVEESVGTLRPDSNIKVYPISKQFA